MRDNVLGKTKRDDGNHPFSHVCRACYMSRVKVPREVVVANSIATCKA